MYKNKKNKKNKSGFSLVELLIVLAIIVIMTIVLFVSQSNNRNQEDTEAAARKVAAQLRQLQNEALSGKQINGTYACDFKFDSDGTATYRVGYNDCATHAAIGSAQPIDINSAKNVNIGTVNVTFTSPRGESAARQVILTSKKDINVKTSVCVCSSGNILEKKDATACPAC